MEGDEFTTDLVGGSPWGFTIQGGVDHRSPLRIGRVTNGGRASNAGLLPGDYILSINTMGTKTMKHLQAQQTIKNSKTTIVLHCTKVRPGLVSPAVTNRPQSTFTFPVTNGNKAPPTRVNPSSIPSPKPIPVANGDVRRGSLSTPSEPTSGSSLSPVSALDVYDGMEWTSAPAPPPQYQDNTPPPPPTITTPTPGVPEQGSTLEEETRPESIPELSEVVPVSSPDQDMRDPSVGGDMTTPPPARVEEGKKEVEAEESKQEVKVEESKEEVEVEESKEVKVEESKEEVEAEESKEEVKVEESKEEVEAEESKEEVEAEESKEEVKVEESKEEVEAEESKEEVKVEESKEEVKVEESKEEVEAEESKEEVKVEEGKEEVEAEESKAEVKVEESKEEVEAEESKEEVKVEESKEEVEAEESKAEVKVEESKEEVEAEESKEEVKVEESKEEVEAEESKEEVKVEESKEEVEAEESKEEVKVEESKEEVEAEESKEEVKVEESKEEVEVEESKEEVEAEESKEEVKVEESKEEVEAEESKEEVEDINEELDDVMKEVEGIAATLEDVKKEVEEKKAEESKEEVEVRPSSKECNPSSQGDGRGRGHSHSNSFSKRELVDLITGAAQARVRRESRESSVDLSDDVKVEGSPQPQQKQEKQEKKTPPPFSSGLPPKAPRRGTDPVIKPVLKKKDPAPPPRAEDSSVAPLLKKDQGWYQQMFQNFTTTVEETFNTASGDPSTSEDKDEEGSSYVYDHRGLKVRRGSLNTDQLKEANSNADQAKISRGVKGEDPIYDERGLRVPQKQGQRHVRSGSTPALMEGGGVTRQGAKFVSVSSGGAIKEDILSSQKKNTAFKSTCYTTEPSRDYWKKKDQDHIQFDHKRKLSLEINSHERTSSLDHTSSHMTSIHPLLRADSNEGVSAPVEPKETSQKLFDRIDPNKLQGALNNASTLTTLEQEGVPSQLLPGLVKTQSQQVEEEKIKKEAKAPPPGKKAQAKFNFDGKNEKELSFGKGDIIDLLHTVDEHWLEGRVGTREGILPTNYVKVLSSAEYRALTSPKPVLPKLEARALFDFQGQTEKELEFNKDDVLYVEKKVDEHWYSGFHGDKKGIFPISYVALIED